LNKKPLLVVIPVSSPLTHAQTQKTLRAIQRHTWNQSKTRAHFTTEKISEN